MKTMGRIRRHRRIRSTVQGTAERPRLSVYKSNTALYIQIIDDVAGKTLVSGDTRTLKGAPHERAAALGAAIAEKAKKANITSVVFDRGGFRFTGNIAVCAEGARAAGLLF